MKIGVAGNRGIPMHYDRVGIAVGVVPAHWDKDEDDEQARQLYHSTDLTAQALAHYLATRLSIEVSASTQPVSFSPPTGAAVPLPSVRRKRKTEQPTQAAAIQMALFF